MDSPPRAKLSVERAAEYEHSPMHKQTQDVLASVGLAEAGTPAATEVTDEMIKPMVHALVRELQAQAEGAMAHISAKSARQTLEKRLGTSLVSRKQLIRAELLAALRASQDSSAPAAKAAPAASVPVPAAERGATAVSPSPLKPVDGTSSSAAVGSAPLADMPPAKTEDGAAAEIDTRHAKPATATAAGGSGVPVVIAKGVGSKGSSYPVLAELFKEGGAKPVDLRGDAGAVGRVSMIDAAGKVPSPQKKSRAKGWAAEAARRYRDGSVLRLDVKGDVFHGVMRESAATMLAVTVTAGKEARVNAVFNQFLRAEYQGNVMKGMAGGEDEGESAGAGAGDSVKAEEAKVARKKAKLAK